MYKLTTRWFHKWAKKQELSKESLLQAIDDLEHNLSTSVLGGGLYKVRVAKDGFGKSSSYRMIIVYKKDDRAIMIYGFAKNKIDNIPKQELVKLKSIAQDILSLEKDVLDSTIKDKVYIDIRGDYDER